MGEKPIVFRGYFSKGTCQMINDTLTGREGVKMDAMRVFRQTKRPSLIGGGLSWLNIRLGARISCHKHYSTGKEGTHTPKNHTATPATGTAWREGSPIPFSLIPFRRGSPAGTRTGARPAGGYAEPMGGALFSIYHSLYSKGYPHAWHGYHFPHAGTWTLGTRARGAPMPGIKVLPHRGMR